MVDESQLNLNNNSFTRNNDLEVAKKEDTFASAMRFLIKNVTKIS